MRPTRGTAAATASWRPVGHAGAAALRGAPAPLNARIPRCPLGAMSPASGRLAARDGGRDWTVSAAPIRSDSASAGIFSIAFRDAQHGVVVGGDYAKDQEDRMNVALTGDGGATWSAPPSRPHGFRSAVAWIPDMRAWIATGTSGSDAAYLKPEEPLYPCDSRVGVVLRAPRKAA